MSISSDSNHIEESSVEKAVYHEENLINTRLTWMLTFQGLLFAAVSLADAGSRVTFFSVIPWIGIAVAALSFLGVLAAYGTIDDVRKKSHGPDFGGTRWRRRFGRTNSFGIPVVIMAAWAVLYIKLS